MRMTNRIEEIATMYEIEQKKLGLFDRGTRLMHWLTFGLMLAVFILAFSIDLAASRASHMAILQAHRLTGLTIWLVTLFRLAWRQNVSYPDWPSDMAKAVQVLAKATEYSLYAMLLLQPILGLLQTNAHGDRVSLWHLGPLPALIGEDRAFAQQLLTAHKVVGFSLLGVIALHISAALFHHFVRRDDILVRMLPVAAVMRRTPTRTRDAAAAAKVDQTTVISSQSTI
jgi:cytochrome b561